MITSVVLNATSGFIMLVTICFTLGDINDALGTPTGYPFIQVFYNATDSLPGTNTMTAIIVLTLTASSITEIATASRQLWSFARDRGLPFSGFFGYVSTPSQMAGVEEGTADSIGYSGVEYSTQRRDGLLRSDQPPLADKYWLYHRPSSHCDADHRFPDVVLRDHNRLPPSQTHPRRTTSASSMDTGPLRNGYQHCGIGLSASGLRVRLFPTILQREQGVDELVRSHVLRNHHHRCHVLHLSRPAPLYPTCCAGKARGVISEHSYCIYTS